MSLQNIKLSRPEWLTSDDSLSAIYDEKDSKEALREQAMVMLMMDLKRAEERALE